MVLFNSLYLAGLVASVAAMVASNLDTSCGKLNIIFTGLPPYHPLVKEMGFDPAKIDGALRADAANIRKAGYNLKVVLMGPEKDLSVLANQVRGTTWDGTGIGYGVRGSNRVDLTLRLQQIIQLYRDDAPIAPIMFDYSPDTALWAIKQRFPLPNNCTDSPGQNLGFNIFCDICPQ